MTEYVLNEEYLGYAAGTRLYRYPGYTYGCKEDDERVMGKECKSLTANPTGGDPFVIVPTSKLSPPNDT